MNLRKATKKDIPFLYALFSACEKKLKSKGHHYWDDVYSKRRINNIIKNDTFIWKDKATFTLSKRPLFGSIKYWRKAKKRKALYLSALAIHPKEQNKGLGKTFCKKAETIAKKRGYKYLRLNSAEELLDYYKNKGFTAVHKKPNFFFLEKRL